MATIPRKGVSLLASVRISGEVAGHATTMKGRGLPYGMGGWFARCNRSGSLTALLLLGVFGIISRTL